MARLKTQEVHARDNMRRLDELENDEHGREILRHHVVELLNELNDLISSHADRLEIDTSEEGPDSGLCHHVGRVLLSHELQEALNRVLAVEGATAVYRGDSRRSVAKAMHKDTANLFKHSAIGDDISRLLDAMDRPWEYGSDGTRKEKSVTLHDGFEYAIQDL
ncbi:hypothetical protein GA0061078_1702 [Bifidobacterium bohemicum]|uniref:Uncharacterized protein n=1 Tax=Bifidobacterium bohemicum DSM 22767 TaxID=1437606 RepID=A0A086ZHB0_9BIFI|nr:hypothetical protein [Bifidobacterium bohemicum]KFI45910.1 hypothetical protein BBOH_0717 [Bifidobacterium bohemicum DSM 22767]SCC16942.1 hypothetical protein GA0061078_1702 [Bifidobacterium bohemicum]